MAIAIVERLRSEPYYTEHYDELFTVAADTIVALTVRVDELESQKIVAPTPPDSAAEIALHRNNAIKWCTEVAFKEAEIARLTKLSEAISRDCNDCANQRNTAEAKLNQRGLLIEQALACIEKYHSFLDMMDDGPDDSDVAMAVGWLNKGRELRREFLAAIDAAKEKS
jgi:hypothetical protein